MVSKAATLDAVETVIDQVDETVDTLERIPNLALNGTTRKQQIVILVATALSAATVAGVVSHLVTKKVVSLKYEDILEEELAAAKRHYTVMQEKPDLTELTEVVLDESEVGQLGEYAGLVTDYSGDEKVVLEEAKPGKLRLSEAQPTMNVFTENPPIGQWNQQVEESKRSEDEPYVISKEEFYEGDLDFQQEQLTYFEEDDTVADLHDKPLPVHEADMMLGDSNLLRFGHGSGDPHVVYIRNARLETDYEVTRAKGSYAQEVAGIIEHSDGGRKVRKFRGYDE
jgi:hypothetical protein